MVTFEREFSLGACADYHLDWYIRHGIIYRIKDGAAGQVLGRLFWAWLGLDGVWVHLDVDDPGTVPATFAAAAFRLAMRRVLPAGLVFCQTAEGGNMQRILSRLGFQKAGQHEEDGTRWAVMMAKIPAKN